MFHSPKLFEGSQEPLAGCFMTFPIDIESHYVASLTLPIRLVVYNNEPALGLSNFFYGLNRHLRASVDIDPHFA